MWAHKTVILYKFTEITESTRRSFRNETKNYFWGGKRAEVELFTTMFLLSVRLKLTERHRSYPTDIFALYNDISLHCGKKYTAKQNSGFCNETTVKFKYFATKF